MSKKIIIISSIILVLVIGSIIIYSNDDKETLAAGSTLADTVIAQSQGTSWSEGATGVYQTNGHEYRYVGKDLASYLTKNNMTLDEYYFKKYGK